MSDFIGLQKDTKVDATDAPGQTFLSLTGEGGTYGDDGANTELCQDREPFEAWFIVSRPPDVADFEETEYAVMRLSGNDDVPVASRNIKIAAAVRTLLGRDLVPGEFCHYTSNGTAECYVDFEPDGTITVGNDNGAGNTSTMVLEPTTGNIDFTTSGTVRVGGALATDYGTLFTQLQTQWAVLIGLFNPHFHNVLGAVTDTAAIAGFTQVALTNAARATKERLI